MVSSVLPCELLHRSKDGLLDGKMKSETVTVTAAHESDTYLLKQSNHISHVQVLTLYESLQVHDIQL